MDLSLNVMMYVLALPYIVNRFTHGVTNATMDVLEKL